MRVYKLMHMNKYVGNYIYDDRSDDMHPKFNRPPKELSPKEIQTSQLKTRKKFKKILSSEQYDKWLIMESNKPEPCPERPMMKQ